MTTVLKNGLVFTKACVFEPLDVVVEDGRITELSENACGSEIFDCSGCYVIPGLTDVHFHGCVGYDLCDGTAEALERIAGYEFSQGVTQICPATMTLPENRLREILSAARDFEQVQAANSARLIGIHMEGPFIAPGRRGAQKAVFIQAPSREKLEGWQRASGGLVRVMTLAPEIDGALELIREFRGMIRFSLGHTDCSYEQAMRAFDAGADRVTHLYNAMPPFHHRRPGLVGAAFDRDDCYAELICDGEHISPAAVRTAFKMIGDDRLVLISDSMEAAGMPDGEYALGGQRVIKTGGRAVLHDGTLAGSVTSLYGCMVKAVEMGIPLESAVKAATITPCRSIGVQDRYGVIAPGREARLVVLDRESLNIRKVIKGQQ